ncbi:MAG: TonB-dependent receptor [Clostridiaceae bacterium]|nr:TonB-dependent receptor [Clostridiaceae bacterium]
MKKKLTFLMCFVAFSLIAQNNERSITISFSNIPLFEAISRIEKSSSFTFIYDTNNINLNSNVSLNANNLPVNQAIEQMLVSQNIDFEIINSQIALFEKTLETENQGGQKIISGTITDENGEPIIGATVRDPNSNSAALTNIYGDFSISVPSDVHKLSISYVGFVSKEVGVTSGEHLKINMEELVKELEEVVVVGYGTQRKVNLIGSVGTVSSSDLEQRPLTNISAALGGLVPGMMVVQGSGQPGKDGGNIRIRGVGTFGDSSPLVLIDGMIGDMDDINPADIENISVLKDAASSAIYGARAANGVILVTTKKGTQNKKTNITYENYFGWQQFTNIPNYLNSFQYASLYNEARINDGLTPTFTDEEIESYRNGTDPDHYPNTNWLKDVFTESGFQQNHSITLAGGNENFLYNSSFRYFDQNGIVKGTGNERYNVRVNLTNNLGKRFRTNVILSLSRQTISFPVSSRPDHNSFEEIIHQAHRINPTVVNRYSDETYGTHTDGNPVAWINEGSNSKSIYDRSIGNFELKYDIVAGLSATGRVGIYNFDDFGKVDVKEQKYYRFGTSTIERFEGPSSISDYNSRSLTIKQEGILNYSGKFFNSHNIDVLLGVSQESNRTFGDMGYRRNIASPSLSQLVAGSEDGQIADSHASSWALRSQFGRLNYNYKGIYLFEANVRRDGTSRFDSSIRWGNFPSFSLGWRLSEEPFMKKFTKVDNIKLRASWGQLGNQNIAGLYPYIATVSLGWNYPFNGVMASGAGVSEAVARNISWETATTFNVGTDLSFFRGLISLSADFYDKLTEGLLLQLPVNPVFGLNPPYQNAAVISNKGFEFLLGHTNRVNKFRYDASLSMMINKNEIIDLKGTTPSLGLYTVQEGVSYNAFYGLESLGLFQSDDEIANSPTQIGSPRPGDIKYKDQLTVDTDGDGIPDKGDGRIDGNDRVVLGNSFPGVEYGFNLKGEYRNFDFAIFLKGAMDVKGYLSSDPVCGITSGASLNEIHLGRWYADENGNPMNPNPTFPRLTLNNGTGNFQASDYWIRDASYLRLKNLQLGYSLPKSIVRPLLISSIRFFVSAENLLTFTKFQKGFDPETPNNFYDYYYPQIKIYSIGLNVKI